jgi:hypothetical protein
LLRAFGPLERPCERKLEPDRASALAIRLGVGERLASRLGAEHLTGVLGTVPAAPLLESVRSAAVSGMRLLALARVVADAAASLGIPLVFTKFLALNARGWVATGARQAVDIDVLVPCPRVERLDEALVEAGLVREDSDDRGHHLVPLRSPLGGAVELHRSLLGVRIDRKSVTADDLLAHGRVERLAAFPGECFVPSEDVLRAHVIVHAFVHHAYPHDSYPLFRAIGDLLDLEAGHSDAPAARDSADAAYALIRKDMPRKRFDAIQRLSHRLGTGDPSLLDELPRKGRSDEAELLAHLVSAAVREPYYAKLFLRGLRPHSDSPLPLAFTEAVLSEIFLTPARMAKTYGRPRSRLGTLGRHVYRPIDLVVRLLR